MQQPDLSHEPADLGPVEYGDQRALALRTARLEDALERLALQVSRALETIAERDRIVVETIGELVREHGEVVTQETSRIAQAMESYVQHGVSAIGQLSGRVDAQLAGTAGGVDARLDAIGQELQLLQEQRGVDAREIQGALERMDRHNHERALNMARLVRSDSEAIRDVLARMAAADAETSGRLDATVERMESSAAAVERAATDVQQAQRQSEEHLAGLVDARVGALARMIRSDHRALAEQMEQGNAAAKQSLRAVKELEANLPEDVLKVLERRIDQIAAQFHHDTQETTEQVARIGDALGRRIDDVALKISQRYDSDIQVVVERMGDAMHALGSLGRPRADRIEVE